MKIDLITNVSHDLKTPLTSIIGYVDLLSRDQTLSAESRDYVTILINKTERLKSIISDLFELAKATSGDAKVDLEEMDMKRLVEQTLGICRSDRRIWICDQISVRSYTHKIYRRQQPHVPSGTKCHRKCLKILPERNQDLPKDHRSRSKYKIRSYKHSIL